MEIRLFVIDYIQTSLILELTILMQSYPIKLQVSRMEVQSVAETKGKGSGAGNDSLWQQMVDRIGCHTDNMYIIWLVQSECRETEKERKKERAPTHPPLSLVSLPLAL